jgi:hypothetical protein
VSDVNCSICARTAYLHLIVEKEHFRLLCGEQCLTGYQFNTRVARHVFCNTCGIKSFYIPRSHPDGISVNARCLDAGTVASIVCIPFDGVHWEQQYPQGRAPALEG